MPKLDTKTLTEVRGLLETYEEEMRTSQYSSNSVAMRIKDAKDFVRWLADEFSPGDYNGGRSVTATFTATPAK